MSDEDDVQSNNQNAEKIAQRLRDEANVRDFTSSDLIYSNHPDLADLAEQITPEVYAVIESWLTTDDDGS